jgi:hypothetical protein
VLLSERNGTDVGLEEPLVGFCAWPLLAVPVANPVGRAVPFQLPLAPPVQKIPEGIWLPLDLLASPEGVPTGTGRTVYVLTIGAYPSPLWFSLKFPAEVEGAVSIGVGIIVTVFSIVTVTMLATGP